MDYSIRDIYEEIQNYSTFILTQLSFSTYDKRVSTCAKRLLKQRRWQEYKTVEHFIY
jgi:hypothetical protein